jgi:hypothetical protein
MLNVQILATGGIRKGNNYSVVTQTTPDLTKRDHLRTPNAISPLRSRRGVDETINYAVSPALSLLDYNPQSVRNYKATSSQIDKRHGFFNRR